MTKNFVAVAAAVTVSALSLTGCSQDGASDDPDGPVTVSITTFGAYDYQELYDEYKRLHPNVTIEANRIDSGGNARTDAFTKIAAGSGLSDVVMIEEGWLGAIMEVSDSFEDLRDYGIEDRASDWLDWKYKQGTDPDGRVIGYGTDIGPEGLCYNTAAFEAAGLPTDREEVAKLLDGDWDKYFEVGRQYHEKTGKAWYDHSGFVWNAMVNQMPEGYYKTDGELNVEGNAQMRARFDQLGAATEDGLSAAQTAWDWNGGKSFIDGTFATFVCPGWMLDTVTGQVEAAGGNPKDTGWDFADVFPGGASNWGGSFLSVNAKSDNKEAAAALADWMTQPAQQVKQFEASGIFPSTIPAQEELAETAKPDAAFNNAPIGAILAERSQGVVAQFKGPDDSVIGEDVFGAALSGLDRGTTNTEQSWDRAIQLLNELVG